jgi:hypothetical protein
MHERSYKGSGCGSACRSNAKIYYRFWGHLSAAKPMQHIEETNEQPNKM